MARRGRRLRVLGGGAVRVNESWTSDGLVGWERGLLWGRGVVGRGWGEGGAAVGGGSGGDGALSKTQRVNGRTLAY